MGFDLDMTRGYGFNRGHIGKTHSKRRNMRELYLKELEGKNYSYYSDTIPGDVKQQVKSDIREKYRIMRRQVLFRSTAAFAALFVLLFLLALLLLM